MDSGPSPAGAPPGLWLVVTADVIRSRRLAPRGDIQRRIEAALERFKRLVAGEDEAPGGWQPYLTPGPGAAARARVSFLGSRFTLGRGDELQGVLRGDAPLLPLLRYLRGLLQPVTLRIGVGLGRLSTPVEVENSWRMDGPAFHRSRAALESLGHTILPRTVFRSHDGPAAGRGSGNGGTGSTGCGPASPDLDPDQRINTVLALVDELMRRWTPGQWEAVQTVEEFGTYREAARKLGVAPQNIHKRVQAAGWWALKPAELLVQLEIHNIITRPAPVRLSSPLWG